MRSALQQLEDSQNSYTRELRRHGPIENDKSEPKIIDLNSSCIDFDKIIQFSDVYHHLSDVKT